ncbi:DNA starvation/stationary phase protection protein DpsA [Halococcus sp. IIIV-5B]|uniref:DNA starvation/stationary phase protection protein DpsA n=1 Tax=Halococcus sp. IIIV-5B TaxID=2321230 RepID=UPI000E756CA6|nr:DNA starvation/stationary phase protection protein DpsA [Halococcus sp. IIIV-5B]RJT03170.1 DNA starvation/stationary phase protection protein [Halococcus sp. IIIV-5B]
MASAPHLRSPDPAHLRQEWGTVTENALGIERAAAEQVVEALNRDVSGLYLLFNQVRKHKWCVEGAEFELLKAFLADAADRLSTITDEVAVRVHALGGVPVCGPMGIRQYAPMDIEAAHRYDVRSSLARDLDGYATLVVGMREHIELAERLGDTGTGEILRRHLPTLEDDGDTLAKCLAGDTLVRSDVLASRR